MNKKHDRTDDLLDFALQIVSWIGSDCF